MLYEDAAETLKKYCVTLFGGTPEEKPEQYAKSSPATYAENVKAPILIIQGHNDTRTPSRPIEVYEEKMKSLGKQIKVHWFDAGHVGPFAQVEQAIEHQALMLKSANEFLGA
jgi:dipeptidyl aminopeptidase/acylaminoacyl peptidase